MPALDTNVLVRYIVQDEETQGAAARRLNRRSIDDGRALFVPITVALEIEWVLRSNFEYSKDRVMAILSNLLSAAELTFESERAFEVALHLYRDSSADFADCLHIALASRARELPLRTLDKRAAKVSSAQAL